MKDETPNIMRRVGEMEDAHSKELFDVLKERVRQYDKFGKQNRAPGKWFLILSEEVGEVAKECVEIEFDDAEHPHSNPEAYYKELTETVAVGLAAMQNYNERKRLDTLNSFYFYADSEERKALAVGQLKQAGYLLPEDDSPRFQYIYFDTYSHRFNAVYSHPGRKSKSATIVAIINLIEDIQNSAAPIEIAEAGRCKPVSLSEEIDAFVAEHLPKPELPNSLAFKGCSACGGEHSGLEIFARESDPYVICPTTNRQVFVTAVSKPAESSREDILALSRRVESGDIQSVAVPLCKADGSPCALDAACRVCVQGAPNGPYEAVPASGAVKTKGPFNGHKAQPE